MNLTKLPEKVKLVREHLGLSISEVIASTGIENLEKIEQGKDTPTGDDLLILSDFYNEDYMFFLFDEHKSAHEGISILYRKFGSEFSKEDRRAIQEFIYLCECEQFLYEELEKKFIKFDYMPQGTFFKAHGKDAAKKLREHIGLSPKDIIPNIFDTFRTLGIHIFRRKLVNSTISGLYIKHPYAGDCILVNYNEDVYRQNFTLTHEVAHAIFDNNEMSNLSKNNDLPNSNPDYLKEVRANTFASEFLITKELIETANVKEWNETTLVYFANHFNVNVLPLLISLKEYGFIDESKFSELRKTYIANSKNDAEFVNLTGKQAERKRTALERGLSKYYIDMCCKAYQDGIISQGRLAEMLFLHQLELSEFLKLYNQNLNIAQSI